ncbi:MAG TPA: hypothetical protein VFO41_06425 [Alphaproteobacteria bacterium]|nr:hypothetical protein [Alphaproteobacteria bacterium]
MVVRAEPVTAEGVEFSDELGGFVLVSVTGSGRLDDPFVIVEEITDGGSAILTVRGFDTTFGNRARTNHFSGMAVTKIVRNATDQTWSDFTMELQEVLGVDSPYGDGLSFGQGPDSFRTVASDRYAHASVVDEPRDGIRFSEGSIRPGESVSFSFVITENSPRSQFFLIQRRLEPVAGPGPAVHSLASAE